MTHAYHEGLEGFVPEALFHTGCPECEYRAGLALPYALAAMDMPNVRRAVIRAARLNADGATCPPDRVDPARLRADPLELRLLRDLWVVLAALGRAGVLAHQAFAERG